MRAFGRAFLFAAPAFGVLGMVVAIAAHYGLRNFGLWVGQTSVLGPLIAVNLVILVYRAVGTVDAYRLAMTPGSHDEPADPDPEPKRRSRVNPLSVAGLVLILTVMVGGHAALGYWNVKVYNALETIYSPVDVGDASPDPSSEPEPTVSFEPQQTIPPAQTPKPWTGKGRLNILLVGVDSQEGGFRTDTMIVVSLDPATHQVAMFSIPRDTYGLPLQPRSRLAAVFGSSYENKLNGLWRKADPYRQLFPGGGADALKQALSYAYGIDIQYYVLVSFDGFRKVIDTLGGVTITVPAPVVDDGYPLSDGSGQHLRVYIPAGTQHMTGQEALTYARSRKASGLYDDFNRSARQEQILVALQQRADLATISANLGDLIDALGKAVHTDIPQGPDFLGPLIDLARHIGPEDIKAYTFAPPTHGSGGLVKSSYVFWPNIKAIRATVKQALSGGPKRPPAVQRAVDEQAPILVENGTGISGQSDALAAQLQALGLEPTVSQEQPSRTDGATRLLVVNGADSAYPATLALLIETLGLSGSPSTDPAAAMVLVDDPQAAVQFVVVAGFPAPSPGASSSAGPAATPSP